MGIARDRWEHNLEKIKRQAKFDREHKQSIKKFYLREYPEDELGMKLNETATFEDLLNELYIGNNIYDFIGVGDSLIRERLFDKLSKNICSSYDYIYNLWLNENK